jgi:alpha-L-fucosidase 2
MPLRIFLFLLLFVSTVRAQQKLWYDKPADVWTKALPLGNGRLGAMVFGGTSEELIQLNESTLWSGGPVNNNVNPDAPKYLPAVREALFKEQYHTADSLLRKMQGVYSQSYLPLGDLRIRQSLAGDTSAYYRDLNIADAKATTRFTSGGVVYTREVFISAPDKVIVIRLKASKVGKLNFVISPSSQLRAHNVVSGKNEIATKGKAPSQVDPNYVDYTREPIIYEEKGSCRGMRFEMRMRALAKDGIVKTDTAGISVSNATEVTILVTAATSFNGFDKCPDSEGLDESALAATAMKQAAATSYEKLLARQQADYHHFFNRVSFTLAGKDMSQLPTDERLRRYTAGGEDASLESLYFQYGRYLLISCSRTLAAPANLQGIWNKELRAPWSSNYTININTQMNYWPAEPCNLMEMQQPLYQLIKELSVTGKHTARNFYNKRGWVAHHNTDIWALSNPVGNMGKGDPMWANWMMGGNWLCQFLWQHYQYTHDKAFLRDTAYPIMKSAAEFSLDWLVRYKQYLVTAPSTSPENKFVTEKGEHETVSIASTMDMSIIRNLFSNVIKASEVLNADVAFRDTLRQTTRHLYPMRIGKDSTLQEWYKDWQGEDPEHRHISHLFGLFPGEEVTPYFSEAAAFKRSLEKRGDGGTGWSKAWKINVWARLWDGNHAYKLLRELLSLADNTATDYHNSGGTYANLFCAHPPFQIDGNFGGTSGIVQMLLQSVNGDIHVLPALPDNWQAGEVKGLRAPGAVTLDITWEKGALTSVVVHAEKDGSCSLHLPVDVKGEGFKKAGDNYKGELKAGGIYKLTRI